jgi:hypothetical protein
MLFNKYLSKVVRNITVPFLVFILFLCGCAHNMAINKEQREIDPSGRSIALLSVKISNQNKPTFQLDLWGVCICPGFESCRTLPNWHKADESYKSEKDKYKDYLLSFDLNAGTHNIHLLSFCYKIPLLLYACAEVPIDLNVETKPNSIVYLGHLDIALRERKSDDEERAALLPLIDAAIVGFSTGTFDVIVEDRYDEDIKRFISEYPALQNSKIEKNILPQWIRPENRKT